MSTNNNPKTHIKLTGNQVHGCYGSVVVVYDGNGNWLYDLPHWTEQLAVDARGDAYNVIGDGDSIVMVLDYLGNNVIDSVTIEGV